MKTAIAALTAIVIGLTSLTAVAPAQAAPLRAVAAPQMQTTQDAVTDVGYRHRRRRAAAGAAAGLAIGLGAVVIGSAIANSSRPRRVHCYIESVEVWSPRYQAYVVRDREVCR